MLQFKQHNIILLYKPLKLSHLQYSPEVNDPQLDWVGTISELLQAAGLLLPLSVAVVLIDLTTIVQYHLDLGIIVLNRVRV